MLSDSISTFITQGLEELSIAQISFGMKVLVVFGFIYLFNVALKSGGSIINFIVYIVAFIKWIMYKIMKKDV